MAESYSVKAVLSAVDNNFSSVFGKASNTANKFKSSTSSLTDTIKGTAVGIGIFKAVGAAVSTMTAHMDDAVSRYDTMNNFPKIMKNLGISAKDSKSAISTLSKELTGLPTTLDDAASGVTRFTSKNNDIKKSTKYFLALNNAIVAGGQSTEIQSSALEQLSQAYSKGKMDMMEWRSLQMAMPAQLNQVAKAMNMSTDALGAGLRDGSISMDEFMDMMVQLNEKGVDGFASFEEQARSATGGIRTAFTNMGTAITRGIANCIGAIDTLLANNGLPTIAQTAIKASEAIDTAFTKIADAIEKLDLKSAALSLGAVLGGAAIAIPGNDIFKKAISGAREYGLTLSDAMGRIQIISGKTSAALKNVGNNLNVETITKKAKNSVNRLNKIFQGAGKSLDTFGGDIASSLETVSTKFSNAGIGVWEKFAGAGEKISSSSASMAKGLRKNINSASKTLSVFTSKASTIAKPFKGIGKVISKSASVGVASMNQMVSALTSIMGIAMSALGPAAILGVVLAGLGVLDSQFGAQIDSLIQTVATKGPFIIKGLVSTITNALPSLMLTGAQMLAGLANAITANLPVIISGGVQIIQSLVQGVAENIPILLPAAINLIGTFANGILSALPQLLLTGMQLLQSLSQGILNNVGLIVQTATNIIQNFTNSVLENLPGIINAGLQILTNLAQGAIQALPQILVVGLNAISTLIQGIASQLPNILQTGVRLVQMLVRGIVQNLPNILSAGLQVISSLLNGITQNLPAIISSGMQIIVSLITGLIQMLPSIVSAGWELIKSLGSAIKEAIPNIITGAVDGIKNIFGGLWDFITGKSEKSSKKTASDLSSMSTNVKNSTKAMQEDVKKNFSTMNSSSVSEATKMKSGVTNSLSDMKNVGSTNMSGFTANVTKDAKNANTSASSSISDMSNNITKSMQQIDEKAVRNIQKSLSKLPQIAKSTMASFNNAFRTGANATQTVAKTMVASINASFALAKNQAQQTGYSIGSGIAKGMLLALITVQSVAMQITTTVIPSLTMLAAAFTSVSTNVTLFSTKLSATAMTMTLFSLNASILVIALQGLIVSFTSVQSASVRLMAAFTTLSISAMMASAQAQASSMGFLLLSTVMISASSGASAMASKLKSAKSGLQAISSGASKAKSSLNSLQSSFRTTTSGLGSIGTKATTSMNQLTTAFKNAAKQAKTVGKQIGNDFVKMMQAGLKKTPSVASKAVNNVVAKLRAGRSKVYSAGAYISKGFAQGMLSCMGTIESAARRMAAAADKAVRAKAKIHSPSKVSTKLGGYWGTGFVNGIMDKVQEVKRVSEELISIPALSMPKVSFAYAGEMSADYDYCHNRVYVIEVPVEIEGREVARASAKYTKEELDKMQAREDRRHGRR